MDCQKNLDDFVRISNEHYLFCCTQQYTSGMHGHIFMNCSCVQPQN